MNSNAHIRDTFDRVVVINLAKRSERLARFSRLFEGWPFKPPQRFEAVDGMQLKLPACKNRGPGAWGCMLSHQTVLASAIADKVSSLFILEDDARPVPDFAARATEFLAKAPSDWDCLMFGGEHLMPPLAVSPGIVRCAGANRTHAYALRGSIMPILFAFWKHYKAEHCDIVLACLMRYFKVYAPNPFLIGQDAGHSDISGHEERLRFLSPGQIQAIARSDSHYAIGSLPDQSGATQPTASCQDSMQLVPG
jgi:GR25 family glycosyltransferase involved in LPS biosynthesis